MARRIHVARLEALTVHARVIDAKQVKHERGGVPKDMGWITVCRESVEQDILFAHVVYADIIEADQISAAVIIREPFDAQKLSSPDCGHRDQPSNDDLGF